MNIKQMIKKLGGNRAAIAKQANISVFSLNNLVAANREVLELKDGRYIVINGKSVIFEGANNEN